MPRTQRAAKPSWRLEHGDCLELLAKMAKGSVDAIVTDPPYGIGFQGADWDHAAIQEWALRNGGERLRPPTIPVQALAAKFARYSALRRYTPPSQEWGVSLRTWRDYYHEFPAVLVVFALPPRSRSEQRERDRAVLERRMQNTIALHRADSRSHDVSVLLVLLDDLKAHGPSAQIFIDPQHPERYLDWLGEPQPAKEW